MVDLVPWASPSLQVFALAGALTASLVFKQVVQDFLIAGFARGVPIGSAITAGLIVLALGYAFFLFKRSFNAAFARFYEADLLVMDQGRAYFKEGAIPPRGWERWLAPDLLALTRKERLQLRRRTTTGRLFAYLSFIILAIALYNKAGLPAHYMAVFPTLVIAVFANPWRQLYHPSSTPPSTKACP